MYKKYVLYLAMIVSASIGINWLIYSEVLSYRVQREIFWLDKANQNQPFNLVIAGDSRIYYGIQADMLKGYNLAFSNISYTKEYLNYIDQVSAKEGDILLGLTAQSLTGLQKDEGWSSYLIEGLLVWGKSKRVLKVLWPHLRDKKNKVVNTPDEKFNNDGSIYSNKPILPGPFDLSRHYESLGEKMPINDEYILLLKNQIQKWQRTGKRVFITWICFAKDVCESERKRLLPLSKQIAISQALIDSGAVEIKASEVNYGTIDGDHLSGDESVKYTQYLKEQIKAKTDI